jgi:hypothetical protein
MRFSPAGPNCTNSHTFPDACFPENRVLLGYYAASSGSYLPTFRDFISEIITYGLTEMSVSNYQYSLHNNPEQRRSHLHRGGNLKSRICVMLITKHLIYLKVTHSAVLIINKKGNVRIT